MNTVRLTNNNLKEKNLSSRKTLEYVFIIRKIIYIRQNMEVREPISQVGIMLGS